MPTSHGAEQAGPRPRRASMRSGSPDTRARSRAARGRRCSTYRHRLDIGTQPSTANAARLRASPRMQQPENPAGQAWTGLSARLHETAIAAVIPCLRRGTQCRCADTRRPLPVAARRPAGPLPGPAPARGGGVFSEDDPASAPQHCVPQRVRDDSSQRQILHGRPSDRLTLRRFGGIFSLDGTQVPINGTFRRE